ncbi:transposase, partial [Nocardia nova]|uniref:transposase n=1 Tax=Nocardia nova TaxID=37330 RepID=UPI003F69D9B6
MVTVVGDRYRVLTDRQWELLELLLPKSEGRVGRNFCENRRIVEGMLYRLRTGVPWRDLPEIFGPWQTVWERHRRYATDGTWDRVLTALLALADTTGDLDWVVSMPAVLEQVAVPRLAGGPPRRNPDTVIADKAYSAASNRDLLRRKRIRSVIPQRSDQVANRKKRGRLAVGWPPGFDKVEYKRRNVVERAFNKAEHWRAVATRYDKLALTYRAGFTLALIVEWLKSFGDTT